MRRSLAVAVALSLGMPAVVAAQPRAVPARASDQGLYLSGRLGFGAPSGDISDDVAGGVRLDPPLDDYVDAKAALWFEIGYRFNQHVRGGFFLELAPTSIDDTYCFRPGCDASDVRFGLDVQLHLAPRQGVDPWVGVGLGVEYLTADTGEDLDGDGIADVAAELTYAGFELPLIEGGVELRLSPRFSLGPYVSLSLAQFTSVTRQRPGERDRRAAIVNEAVHGWLQVGVRGTIEL